MVSASMEAATCNSGAGCETCNQQGYFGRTAIFEMIPVDDQVRQLTTERVSAVQLRDYVRSQGHGSLRDDGLRLVRLGRSTPDEVLRVTRAD